MLKDGWHCSRCNRHVVIPGERRFVLWGMLLCPRCERAFDEQLNAGRRKRVRRDLRELRRSYAKRQLANV